MGQYEILVLLKKHRGQKFTAKQINVFRKQSPSAVSVALRALRRNCMVNYELQNSQAYIYWHKEDKRWVKEIF